VLAVGMMQDSYGVRMTPCIQQEPRCCVEASQREQCAQAMFADVETPSVTLQVHVFVGGVEEKLMANKAIKQAVEVMMNPGGKMSRVQEILRRALDFELPRIYLRQHNAADC
jgi:hypothetical protein